MEQAQLVFGFETQNYVLHGLESRGMDDMLDQVKQQGYNLIRVPYSNDMLKAIERNMYILLDYYRPDANTQSELWYIAFVTDEQLINDWVKLAKRYKNNPNVIGADLHNEPRGQASWLRDK